MNNKPEWISALGALLLGVLTSAISHHTTDRGEVAVPKELLINTVTCSTLLVGWLVSWLMIYRKRDSKRERIKNAMAKGRMICWCSPEGEIFTSSHTLDYGKIEVIHCDACDDYHTLGPGEVLIDENTEFSPPLPDKVRRNWLEHSKKGIITIN